MKNFKYLYVRTCTIVEQYGNALCVVLMRHTHFIFIESCSNILFCPLTNFKNHFQLS